MKKYHKKIALLFLMTIVLNLSEFLGDYFFGDRDGDIASLGISQFINYVQLISFALIGIILFRKERVFFIYLLALYFVIDFLILGNAISNLRSKSEGEIFRDPRPYIGFTGKSDTLGHGKEGFLGPPLKDAKNNDFTIAFFGGSTGYNGNPTIATLIKNNLTKKNYNNGRVFISNFSVVSSNHNQHLHMLIENLMPNKVDLVIFYGGANEIIQPTFYDSRAGYPYNYFYIHDVPKWKKILIENSFIFSKFQHKITNQYKNSDIVYTKPWKESIVSNYFDTLSKAKMLVNSLKSNIIERPVFLAFYQPHQVPKKATGMHGILKERSTKINYLFDVSDAYDDLDSPFIDIVHVEQEPKEVMAKRISELIIKSFVLK